MVENNDQNDKDNQIKPIRMIEIPADESFTDNYQYKIYDNAKLSKMSFYKNSSVSSITDGFTNKWNSQTYYRNNYEGPTSTSEIYSNFFEQGFREEELRKEKEKLRKEKEIALSELKDSISARALHGVEEIIELVRTSKMTTTNGYLALKALGEAVLPFVNNETFLILNEVLKKWRIVSEEEEQNNEQFKPIEVVESSESDW